MENTKEKSKASTTTVGRSELPNDVIENIFGRLPTLDLARIKTLSSFWKSFAESILPTRLHKPPLLVLPPQHNDEQNGFTNYSSEVVDRCRFVNLRDKIAYPMNKKLSDQLDGIDIVCIGSSHGWLIFSDWFNLIPSLYNPFTDEKIILPSFKSLINVSLIQLIDDKERLFVCLINNEWVYMNITKLFRSFVTKAILTADPATGDYGMVLISSYCKDKDKLLYYKKGDDSWRKFFTSEINFSNLQDMICYENRIYVVEDYYNWIYTWDLENGYPGKMVLTKPTTLSTLAPVYDGLDTLDRVGAKKYLVELNGEILLVLRFIAVPLEDLSFTRRTVLFRVYKLDSGNKEWVKVNTIGHNVSLFVGINHSMAVSMEGFEDGRENCVYFTHDSVNLSDNDWRGRDMGVYNLNSEEELDDMKPILGLNCPPDFEFWPVPCWLLPSK